MKKADKKTWNNTWNKLKRHIAASDMDKLIFKELSRFVDFKDKQIIELGCGKGILSFFMIKNGAKAVNLLDFSQEALNLARDLFADVHNAEFTKSNIFELDEAKKYDIVFSSGVVEHFSGRLREEIIHKHLRLTQDTCVIIVPARPHFNTIRHKKKSVQALYGWQYAFSKEEMKEIIEKLSGYDIVLNRRFYPLYGINLSSLFEIESKFILLYLWNFALKYVDKIFEKIKLYRIFNRLLSPFSDLFGGLLIVVAKKK